MKRCGRFHHVKPRCEFYKKTSAKGGLQGHCKKCSKSESSKRYRANPQRMVEAKDRWFQNNPERADYLRHRATCRRFGITPEQYQEMLDKQNGGCAVCHRPCPTGRRLAIDHDHKTGTVRRLLCARCNWVLGAVEDDPLLLEALKDYLRAHQPRKVLRKK